MLSKKSLVLSLVVSCATGFIAPRATRHRLSFTVQSAGLQQSCFAANGTSTEFVFEEDVFVEQVEQQRRALEELMAQEDSGLLASGTTTMPQVHEEQEGTTTLAMLPPSQEQEGTTTLATLPPSTTTVDDDKNILNARLLLLGAAALYGTNFSFVKMLGDVMPVGISSVLRFGLAALATLPWLLQPSKDGTKVQLGATLAGLEVGTWNSIGYVAQAVGLETTDASKSAFLCSLAVVIVPVLDYFLAGKKLLPREVLGACMAVSGVAFLELGGGAALGDWSFGDICSLIQPLAFGVGFWRMERGMRLFPGEASRSTASQLLAVFGASALYCGATSDGSVDLQQITNWMTDPILLAALFWTGVVTTALTVWMETTALKTLSAAETTLIFATEPLWGTACAAVVMGEHLGMSAAAGALLILSGCIFSNLGVDGMKDYIKQQDIASKATMWDLAAAFASFSGAIIAGEAMVATTMANDIAIVEEVITSASETL